MKSNNDMINSVMYEVNEFEEKKKHRRKKLRISIGVFVSLLRFLVFLAFHAHIYLRLGVLDNSRMYSELNLGSPENFV